MSISNKRIKKFAAAQGITYNRFGKTLIAARRWPTVNDTSTM
ncbi:hypothetical protein [Granulicella tundricola]|nr:hypothetical protein [Granulicella tundricola]